MEYLNPFEQALTGLEIKDWIWHNIYSKTKYTALARRMHAFFNLDDEKIYMLKLCDGAPIAKEVPNKGEKYDIPCD